jgi:transcriptional regulator with AAA-type ATPase domain
MRVDMTGDKEKVLFSWLGNGDILHTNRNSKLSGALASAIEFVHPDKVFLLNGQDYAKKPDYGDDRSRKEQVKSCVKTLKRSLGDRLLVQRVENFNPIDYQAICQHIIPFLKKHYSKDQETFFLQTSGTPSTAVVWILLAQNRFPAQLVQTSEQKPAELLNLPFRVVADFIPAGQDSSLEELIAPDDARGEIIYSGEPMRSLLRRTDRVAIHNVPVLILGESGTGKELFAKRIHEKSRRSGKMIIVNCGAIPKHLAESELFGHKKGAFTGADKDKEGKFKAAHNGTLFLDEIGELPADCQTKVLRAIQSGTITKVGGNDEEKIDIRIVAATHRDLQADVADGRFREDLFYRLAVGVIEIPSLSERKGDALLIASTFLTQANQEAKEMLADNYTVKMFDETAKLFIKQSRWRGNVRELNNTIRRVCIWEDDAVITAMDIEKEMIKIPVSTQSLNILDRPLDEVFSPSL